MKKYILLTSILILSGCTANAPVNEEPIVPSPVLTPIETSVETLPTQETQENQPIRQEPVSPYQVITTPIQESNGEKIDVYLKGNLVYTLEPIDGLGSYYKIVGDLIFVDYGTGVNMRTMRIYDVIGKTMVFETKYNGETAIDGDFFNFNFPVSSVGVVCANLEEIKSMGGSVSYEQKISYNFETKKSIKMGDPYCAYAE